MESNQDNYNQNSDVISIKEIIVKVKEYLSFFWAKKLFFIFPFVLFVGYFVYNAKTTPWMYLGETKFFLEGGSGRNTGLGGLLGQITGGSKKTNPFQILEVANSKLQMSKVLFEKIGPDSTFIANKILEVYDLPAQWAEDDKEYEGFEFKNASVEDFTPLENKVLMKLIRKTVDNRNNTALMTIQFDEDKGYYSINVKTLSHELTLKLSEVSYASLKSYFEDKTREDLLKTRELLKVKSDSIKGLLDSKISQLATFRDRNKSLVYNIDQVQEVMLEGEIIGLNAAYMEVLKSYEMADYKYLDQKKQFMLIDKPMPPLGLVFSNWKIEAVKGGVISILLTLFFLFVYKSYNDLMEA